jgi:hypothetical protein
MHFMPIVPIGMLDVLDITKTRNVFILSQYWNIKKYREFYLSHYWDTVVLDNALYEDTEATNFESMLGMARQLKADRVFVVGPEKLDSGIKTGQMTVDILEEYDTDGYLDDHIQLMCILHERPNEMLRQWNMIRRFEDVALGISIFSYRLGYDRGGLLKFLNLPSDRYVHAFGWDNLLEVYNMSGRFNSVDASIAVSAAINNVDLKWNWQITRNPVYDGRVISSRLPIDSDIKPKDKTKLKVIENIRFLTDFCAADGDMIFKESELP